MVNKEADEVSKWHSRISEAKKFRDAVKEEQKWETYVKQYQGNYELSSFQVPVIPINLVFSYIHTEIPRLYFRDPYITINPKTGATVQKAKILEIVINYLFTELNIKAEIFKVLLDTLITGHGWLKFGYWGQFGSIKTPAELKGTGKNTEALDEVNEFVKNESVFCRFVSWEDIVFDTTAKDVPYDCSWVAHRVVKSLKSVKESEMYKNTETLNANYKPDDKMKTDKEMVEIWEIWDKDSNMVYVITAGINKFLRSIPNPYDTMGGLPFSMLKFNPIPGRPYPLSDIAIIQPQILERIKLRSMQLNHLKRWNRQIFMEEGVLTEEEMSKFKLGIDGAIITTQPDAISKNKIWMPNYSQMQSEIFQVDNLIQLDLDTVSGQTQTDRGAPANTRTRTLGEIELLQQGSLNRSERKKDSVEDFIEEVAKKIIHLIKQFQVTNKYVRALEQDGTTLNLVGDKFDGNGVSFNREDIQGDYDLDVRAGSTIPLSKENRLKILGQILQLGPTIGIMPGGKVSQVVGKEILTDLGIKEVEKAFAEDVGRMNMMQGGAGQMPPSGMPGQMPPASPMMEGPQGGMPSEM